MDAPAENDMLFQNLQSASSKMSDIVRTMSLTMMGAAWLLNDKQLPISNHIVSIFEFSILALLIDFTQYVTDVTLSLATNFISPRIEKINCFILYALLYAKAAFALIAAILLLQYAASKRQPNTPVPPRSRLVIMPMCATR